MEKFTEKDIRERVQGIISYYPGNSEMIPRLIHHDPIRILMSPKQDSEYWKTYQKEVVLAIGPNEKLKNVNPKLYALMKRLQPMAKLRVMSRRVSNIYYDGNANRRQDTFETGEYDELKELQRQKNTELFLSEDDYNPLQLSTNGWLTEDKIRDGSLLKLYSPKIAILLYNIVVNNEKKHVVFSFFKQKSGAMLISTLLKHCGIPNEIFSGDLNDSKRKNILKRFNAEDNMKGEKVRVLIITEAGSEGISILEAGHLHILESSARPVKIIQAIGRVARYKSHDRLSEDERIVHVWRYWSVSTSAPITLDIPTEDGKVKKKTIKNKATIDEILFYKAKEIEVEVNRFTKILKEESI
jgi:superfamily II DNA or RNA helicase